MNQNSPSQDLLDSANVSADNAASKTAVLSQELAAQKNRYLRVRREAIRLTAEVDEDGLGDFLRQLPGTDQAERGGKDEIEVATDDFGEGILRVLPGVSRKQLQIGIAHFISISLPTRKPDGKNWNNRVEHLPLR